MKTSLNPTRNDLPEDTRCAMVDLLNQNLADVLDLGLQAKHAHWNVKGPHFIALHELFDKVAEDLEGFADEIAERAVALGGTALGTVQSISRDTRLKPYLATASSSDEHLSALSAALAVYGQAVRAAIDIAAKRGDAGTSDLFTQVSRGVDKWLWMVEAHIQTAT